ncbi:MAG: M14 family metallopeptidase [Pseudomonadota bacterium]
MLRVVVLALLLTGCATAPAPGTCSTDRFSIDESFVGARAGDCIGRGSRTLRILIEPEDDKVRNPSPWYAFRVVPAKPGPVRIILDYDDWKHRYVPKRSLDGGVFKPLPYAAWRTTREGSRLVLNLELGDTPVLIAAHELLMPELYETWSRRIEASSPATLQTIGRSRGELPIYSLDTGGAGRDTVLLTGRQHPPEVSGAVAMFAFVETVFGDSNLATRFRERFRVIAVPLMNPDGVIDGNWRHNNGETDLNRDWGPFSQPETQAIRSLLDELDAETSAVVSFLDFHSTRENKFFTQTAATEPADFTRTWLARSAERIENYPFENDPRPVSATANGKNYMYKRYGIPSVTYEVGDETDRDAVRASATVFAEEFMRLWLEQ